MTVPINNMTDTWNNPATVFTSILMDITNTQSAVGSKPFDIKIGGTSWFTNSIGAGSVNQVNIAQVFGGSGSQYDGYFIGGAATYGMAKPANGAGALYLFGGPGVIFAASGTAGVGFSLYSGYSLGFAAGVAQSPVYNAANDVGISRNAAGILQLMNVGTKTNPAALQVYNTTDAETGAPTNYERGGLDWVTTSNVFRIRSEAGGTGTQRIIAVDGFNKAGAPANTDIPAGTYGFLRDTAGSHTYLIYNNAGTIQKLELV